MWAFWKQPAAVVVNEKSTGPAPHERVVGLAAWASLCHAGHNHKTCTSFMKQGRRADETVQSSETQLHVAH